MSSNLAVIYFRAPIINKTIYSGSGSIDTCCCFVDRPFLNLKDRLQQMRDRQYIFTNLRLTSCLHF